MILRIDGVAETPISFIAGIWQALDMPRVSSGICKKHYVSDIDLFIWPSMIFAATFYEFIKHVPSPRRVNRGEGVLSALGISDRRIDRDVDPIWVPPFFRHGEDAVDDHGKMQMIATRHA